jgi:hypothetical protein
LGLTPAAPSPPGSRPHGVLAVTRSLARHGAAIVLGIPESADCPAAMTRHCWVGAMATSTPARVLTFGFGADNDVRASGLHLDWPHGTRFDIHV